MAYETKKLFYKDFADKIIKTIEERDKPWPKSLGWENAEAYDRSPRNPISGTIYRGVNSINLALTAKKNGWDDPRWLTYKQAQDNGYQVRKGERHTKVIFYEERKIESQIDNENQKEDNEEEKKVIVKFFQVFNASQIEGIPPLEISKLTHKWDPIEKAEEILRNSGAKIEHEVGKGAGYYYSSDKIILPPKEQFKSAEVYYSTAFHELAHWTATKDRLNRTNNSRDYSEYAREELRAEIAAWMLCEQLGLQTDAEVERSAGYIDSWRKQISSDYRDGKINAGEIMRACRDAEKIRTYIMEFAKEKDVAQEFENEGEKVAPSTQEKAPEPAQAKTTTMQGRTYLFVPYAEKELAKAHGAKWDKEQKSWYAPEGTDLEPLKKWLEPPQKAIMAQKPLDPREEFAEKLKAMDLDLKGELPIMDGKIHRVPLLSKNGQGRDGAYCLYSDGRPAGWAQNYVTGESQKLVATGVVLSPQAIEAQKLERQQKLIQREAELKKQQDLVAEKAEKIMEDTRFGTDINPALHPYSINKEIDPFGARLSKDNSQLIIPVHNIEGKIRGIQFIDENGGKKFLAGMEKKGNFHLMDEESILEKTRDPKLTKTEIVLCEGYATGASLHEATGKPVAVAFDAGNLRQVAEKLREKYPQAQIVIAADNDHMKVNNIGLENAKIAAKAVGGKVVVPTFNKEEREKGYTDFNDLQKSRGLKEIKNQFTKQLKQDRGWER